MQEASTKPNATRDSKRSSKAYRQRPSSTKDTRASRAIQESVYEIPITTRSGLDIIYSEQSRKDASLGGLSTIESMQRILKEVEEYQENPFMMQPTNNFEDLKREVEIHIGEIMPYAYHYFSSSSYLYVGEDICDGSIHAMQIKSFDDVYEKDRKVWNLLITCLAILNKKGLGTIYDDYMLEWMVEGKGDLEEGDAMYVDMVNGQSTPTLKALANINKHKFSWKNLWTRINASRDTIFQRHLGWIEKVYQFAKKYQGINLYQYEFHVDVNEYTPIWKRFMIFYEIDSPLFKEHMSLPNNCASLILIGRGWVDGDNGEIEYHDGRGLPKEFIYEIREILGYEFTV